MGANQVMGLLISLDDNAGMVYTKAAEKVLPCTVTLYIPSDKSGGSIEALGSGVLYHENDDYFLLTAGHCIKQDGQKILSGILDGRAYKALNGMAMVDPGLDNKIDVGIIKLDEESRDACLRNHKFITPQQIFNNTASVTKPTEYMLAGFPISKVSINHVAKRVAKDMAPFLCQSQDAYYYQKLVFHPAESLLVKLDRRRSQIWGSGEKSMAPKLKGISGGGMWYVPNYFVQDLDNVVPYLAGIFIEYHPNFRTAVATKFEVFAPLIKGIQAAKTLS